MNRLEGGVLAFLLHPIRDNGACDGGGDARKRKRRRWRRTQRHWNFLPVLTHALSCKEIGWLFSFFFLVYFFSPSNVGLDLASSYLLLFFPLPYFVCLVRLGIYSLNMLMIVLFLHNDYTFIGIMLWTWLRFSFSFFLAYNFFSFSFFLFSFYTSCFYFLVVFFFFFLCWFKPCIRFFFFFHSYLSSRHSNLFHFISYLE